MMPMIFIFGFTKKYLKEKKLRPIKDAPIRSRLDVPSDHRRKYERGYKGELCAQDIAPL